MFHLLFPKHNTNTVTYNIRLKQIWRRNYFYIPTIALYDLARSSLTVVIYSRKKRYSVSGNNIRTTAHMRLSSEICLVYLPWFDYTGKTTFPRNTQTQTFLFPKRTDLCIFCHLDKRTQA